MELVAGVEVKLDKVRKLRFDMNAMMAFERATGKNIRKLDYDDLSATDVTTLVWACLLDEDADLTIGVVGKAINPSNLEDVSAQLLKAIRASLPATRGSVSPQT